MRFWKSTAAGAVAWILSFGVMADDCTCGECCARLTPRKLEIQRRWTDLRQWMEMTLADPRLEDAAPRLRRMRPP